MTWVGLRCATCGIVACGSGNSVLNADELIHAKTGGPPSHNFYGTLRYSPGESVCDLLPARADRQKCANQQFE